MYTWTLSLVDLGNISERSFQGLTVQSIRFYDIHQLASQTYLQPNCRNNNKNGLIYCQLLHQNTQRKVTCFGKSNLHVSEIPHLPQSVEGRVQLLRKCLGDLYIGECLSAPHSQYTELMRSDPFAAREENPSQVHICASCSL